MAGDVGGASIVCTVQTDCTVHWLMMHRPQKFNSRLLQICLCPDGREFSERYCLVFMCLCVLFWPGSGLGLYQGTRVYKLSKIILYSYCGEA